MGRAIVDSHLSDYNTEVLNQKLATLKDSVPTECRLKGNHSFRHKYRINVVNDELQVQRRTLLFHRSTTSQSACDKSTRSQIINSTLSSKNFSEEVLFRLIEDKKIHPARLNILAKHIPIEKVIALSTQATRTAQPDNVQEFLKSIDLNRFDLNVIESPDELEAVLSQCNSHEVMALIDMALEKIGISNLKSFCESSKPGSFWYKLYNLPAEEAIELSVSQLPKLSIICPQYKLENFDEWTKSLSVANKTKLLISFPTDKAIIALSRTSNKEFGEIVFELTKMVSNNQDGKSLTETEKRISNLLKKVSDIISRKDLITYKNDDIFKNLKEKIKDFFSVNENLDLIFSQEKTIINCYLIFIIYYSLREIDNSTQLILETQIMALSYSSFLIVTDLFSDRTIYEFLTKENMAALMKLSDKERWSSCFYSAIYQQQCKKDEGSQFERFRLFSIFKHDMNIWLHYTDEEIIAFASLAINSNEQTESFLRSLPPQLYKHINLVLTPENIEIVDFNCIPVATWNHWLEKDFENAKQYLFRLDAEKLESIRSSYVTFNETQNNEHRTADLVNIASGLDDEKITRLTKKQLSEVIVILNSLPAEIIKDKLQGLSDDNLLTILNKLNISLIKDFISIADPQQALNILNRLTKTNKLDFNQIDDEVWKTWIETDFEDAKRYLKFLSKERLKKIKTNNELLTVKRDGIINYYKLSCYLNNANIAKPTFQQFYELNNLLNSLPPQIVYDRLKELSDENFCKVLKRLNPTLIAYVLSASSAHKRVTILRHHSDLIRKIDFNSITDVAWDNWLNKDFEETKQYFKYLSQGQLEKIKKRNYLIEITIKGTQQVIQVTNQFNHKLLQELEDDDLASIVQMIKKLPAQTISEFLQCLSTDDSCWVLTQLHPFCAVDALFHCEDVPTELITRLATLYSEPTDKSNKFLSKYLVKQQIPEFFSRLATFDRTELPGEDYSIQWFKMDLNDMVKCALKKIPKDTLTKIALQSEHPVSTIFTAVLLNHCLLPNPLPSTHPLVKSLASKTDIELSVFANHLNTKILVDWVAGRRKDYPKLSLRPETQELVFARIRAVGLAGSKLASRKEKNNRAANMIFNDLVAIFCSKSIPISRQAEIFMHLGSELTAKLRVTHPDNSYDHLFISSVCSKLLVHLPNSEHNLGSFLAAIPARCVGALFKAITNFNPNVGDLVLISSEAWACWLKDDFCNAYTYFRKLPDDLKQRIISQINFDDWQKIAVNFARDDLLDWVNRTSVEQLAYWIEQFDEFNIDTAINILVEQNKTHLISRLPKNKIDEVICFIISNILNDLNESDKPEEVDILKTILIENYLSTEIAELLVRLYQQEPEELMKVLEKVVQDTPSCKQDLEQALKENNHNAVLKVIGKFAVHHAIREDHQAAVTLQKVFRGQQQRIKNHEAKTVETRFDRIQVLESDHLRIFFDLDRVFPPVYQPKQSWQHATIPNGAYKYPVSSDHRMIEFAATEKNPQTSSITPVSSETNARNKKLFNKMKEVLIADGRQENNPFQDSAIQPGLQGLVVGEQKLISVRAGEGLDSHLIKNCEQGELKNSGCFRQLLVDMELMHENHIFFRDIKASNLLYVDHEKKKDGTILKLPKPKLMFIDLGDICFSPASETTEPPIGNLNIFLGTPCRVTWELFEQRQKGDRLAARSADEYAILGTFLRSVSKEISKLPQAPCEVRYHPNFFGPNANRRHPCGLKENNTFKKGILNQSSLHPSQRQTYIAECKPFIKENYQDEIISFLEDPINNPLKHKLSEMLIMSD